MYAKLILGLALITAGLLQASSPIFTQVCGAGVVLGSSQLIDHMLKGDMHGVAQLKRYGRYLLAERLDILSAQEVDHLNLSAEDGKFVKNRLMFFPLAHHADKITKIIKVKYKTQSGNFYWVAFAVHNEGGSLVVRYSIVRALDSHHRKQRHIQHHGNLRNENGYHG